MQMTMICGSVITMDKSQQTAYSITRIISEYLHKASIVIKTNKDNE